jgi:hypothetical protein
VSTACTPLPHVGTTTFLQLRESAWSGGFDREKRSMYILKTVLTATSDDDLITLFIPLQNGARTNSEPASHLGWNGNLPLGGEFRDGERHSPHYHGNEVGAIFNTREGSSLFSRGSAERWRSGNAGPRASCRWVEQGPGSNRAALHATSGPWALRHHANCRWC